MSQPIEEKKILIAGLGNPGERYKKTRHNLGFMVLDRLAEKLGISFSNRKHFQGDSCSLLLSGTLTTIHLLKPQTYMNCSGESLLKTAKYFKVDTENILAVCDDMDLDFGTLRLRASGSPGGHNGLRSIESLLGSNSYSRLKLGVNSELLKKLREIKDREAVKRFVLTGFSPEESDKLPLFLNTARDLVFEWVQGKKSATVRI